jgi:hypothetical protein
MSTARKARRKGNRFRRHKRKAWLLRQREKKLERRNRKKNCPDSGFRPLAGIHLNARTKRSVNVDKEKMITIALPEHLDFEDNYENTVSHFSVLREAVQNRKRIRSLDFSSIKFISPSAALVLASEVDQWNQRIRGRLKASLPSWDEDLKRLLCQMGYFELLQIEKPATDWPTGKTTFLKFKRGQANEPNGGQLARQLRMEIEQIVGQKIKKHFLFEGLSEAITNVGQHAYRGIGDHKRRQWWLSASFNSEDKTLCITFYDQGEGIPQTIPTSGIAEFIKDYSGFWSDSQKIKAATEVGRTASGQAERGKGLQDLIVFAKAHSFGKLSIYSLRGLYMQMFSQNGIPAEQNSLRRDFENSIGGTLIEWSVKL